MTLKLLKAIDEAKQELPAFAKQAVAGNVPAIQRNYAAITGQKRNRTFFYRQAFASPDHKPAILTVADLYFSTAPASLASGRQIINALEFCEAVVKPFLIKTRTRDFWEIEFDLSNTMVELRAAYVRGDRFELVQAAQRLKRAAQELTDVLAIAAVN